MLGKTVTLLSDWGNSDHYAAVVRAKVLSLVPEASVVDISHSVPRDDIYAAAFMMFDTYPYFPEGSVHIIGVNDIASIESPHVVMKFDNHFFVGADNGFFTLLQIISGKKAQAVYEIKVCQDPEVYTFTFPSRDLFPQVAALLLNGTPLEAIGDATVLQTTMLDRGIFQTTTECDCNGQAVGCVLSGKVFYVDYFGNIITNITFEKYSACLKNYPFSDLQLGWKSVSGRFVKAYKDVPEGDIAFIFLTNGLLEIAMNRAHAGELLGVDRNTKVSLRFGQNKK